MLGELVEVPITEIPPTILGNTNGNDGVLLHLLHDTGGRDTGDGVFGAISPVDNSNSGGSHAIKITQSFRLIPTDQWRLQQHLVVFPAKRVMVT